MLTLTPAQLAMAEAGGKHPHWRFRLSDQDVNWGDLVLGRRRVKPGTISDPVLIRADGTPDVLLAGAVDDLAAGISHVIRTEDQLSRTAIQIDLISALGGNPGAIAFGHLPQMTSAQGTPLARRSSGRHVAQSAS